MNAIETILALLLVSSPDSSGVKPRDAKHVVVYKEEGRFGGWPANHGIWIWGDEILVGFSRGWYKDLGDRHHIDREKPEEHLLARSKDGGETWTIENPAEKGDLIPEGSSLHGIQPPWLKTKPWTDCPGGIDFTHTDFAMTVRMTDVDKGPSRFYISTNRGHDWDGPYRLPDLVPGGFAARTDYIVNGPHDCMLFLTGAKSNGEEGRPCMIRTADGGKTWKFVSWIMDEPIGFGIMPSTVRLSETTLVSAIRRREDKSETEKHRWNDVYISEDNGSTWRYLSTPIEDLGEGNPPSMIRLADGRICTTYGVRKKPFGIHARISADGGKSWGPEIILRDDGGGRDIGYPRTVQRPDGKIVTVYYFCDDTKEERYIGATIWSAEGL
ncbi:MAG: hypothetical protein GHCLOJNM_04050 [bacterium]|nr:hypothetical protein [bacterium]